MIMANDEIIVVSTNYISGYRITKVFWYDMGNNGQEQRHRGKHDGRPQGA